MSATTQAPDAARAEAETLTSGGMRALWIQLVVVLLAIVGLWSYLAFGDLSENYEYKAAKQAQNKNRSRMRYLEGMIKTASVIDDNSKADEVGLFDKVEVYMPEDDETDIIQVVTTVRCDPRKGLISMDSPFGKQILGKKVGDKFTVHVSDTYSYEAEIRSITKTDDDGSAPLMSY